MLDQGYSLEAIEMLNWGNFHGLQKIQLRTPSHDGLLFAPPPASAIIGINGSGKSTLIDGLMMALLPFENSLKLGVTNDVEGGSSGGRTIRDYVLGKFSSSSEGAALSLENVYGRKEGCSIFLVRFRHNHHPQRVLSFGRLWWYQNFRVSDSQLAFIHYNTLSISQMCEDNKPPKNIRTFRETMKTILPELQIFDTVGNYFMSLSNALGSINKDDLKILNRAFYVKSISQIDQFIRENMLIEQDNPHLDRLLENVRNGQEIAHAIHTCNQKISAIEKILKQLGRLEEVANRKLNVDFDRQILSLYKDWIDFENLKNQIQSINDDLHSLKTRLPLLETETQDLSALKDRLQHQLYQKDIDSRLQQVESEIRHLMEKAQWLETQKQQFETRVKKLNLKLPSTPENWSDLQNQVQSQLDKIDTQILQINTDLENHRERKIQIEQESKILRDELEHLSKFRTLIPKDLYSIKESAQAELKLPEGHLYFVGELIQIKSRFQSYRRAIESVLFPISRNLLCHPDSLNILTKWLDKKGLKADITVKRIKTEELEAPVTPPSEYEVSEMVLEMIDVLPANEHPFYQYLWKWLLDVFDYKLVPVGKFKSDEQKLVTEEGLVKTDNRTSRKLKTHFSFSLGWDNRETIENLTQTLIRLNTNQQETKTALEKGLQDLNILEDSKRNLIYLRDEQSTEFLTLISLQKQIQTLSGEKQELLKANPDYLKLKKEAEDVSRSLEVSFARLSDAKAQIENKTQDLEKITNIWTAGKKELISSLLYGEAVYRLGSEDALTSALQTLHEKLESTKTSRIAYEADLQKLSASLDNQKLLLVSKASQELGSYRRDFNDPNLNYAVTDGQDIMELITSWRLAEDMLRLTELPQAHDKWRKFFDQILIESVKDTINEIKAKSHEISTSIQSVNAVLKLTHFEDLPTEKRYLKIDIQSSNDDRIRQFKRQMEAVEKTLGPSFRTQVELQSENIMKTLTNFVEELQKDVNYRLFVTDVRNHFHFKVQSLRRMEGQEDIVVETFTGARKDAKSSAQTTQLAYALLASCLAFRFHFHDPVRGKDTPRLLILDEFGGKFDNEKPKEILKLLDQMGFQSILVSPMSKADLLSEHVNYLVLVHKVSASHSKTQSYPVTSRQEYERLLGKRSMETASV